MSSVGQALGGIVGGAIGFFVGGPAGALKGAQLGIMAGGIIDPPPGPVINGPRLDDLSVQTSTYGAFIPRNYGTIAQTGNVFWLKGDSLTETAVSTESGGKGGPTTTTNTWEYSATFAVGLCEGPIDGVRRIWIGNQLWYDAGSSDLSTIIASNEKEAIFTLYLGTDTQLPDPLIQADKGAANVPAYRGLAYIVFDNLPLADYNNSLAGAQVKVEIVKSGNKDVWVVRESDTYVTDVDLSNTAVPYADENAFYEWTIDSIATYPDESTFTIWRVDNVTGDRIPYKTVFAAIEEGFGKTGSLGYACRGYCDINAIAIVNTPQRGLTIVDEYGGTIVSYPPTGSTFYIEVFNLIDGLLIYTAGTTGASGANKKLVLHDISSGVIEEYAFPITVDATYSVARSGDRVFVVSLLGTVKSIQIFDLSTKLFIYSDTLLNFLVSGLPPYSTASDAHFYWSGNPSSKYLFLESASVLYKLDTTTFGLTTILNAPNAHRSSISEHLLYYSVGENVLLMRHIAGSTGGSSYFERYTNGLISSSTIQLSSVIESECLTSSLLTAGDLDVTELTDTVRGYRIASQGAIRGGLDPLRAAWPFDVVQHGYQIKFKRRGSASVATIDASELDAREAGSDPGVQITNSRDMDTLLPRLLTLKYIDADREYDVNEQPAQRGA